MKRVVSGLLLSILVFLCSSCSNTREPFYSLYYSPSEEITTAWENRAENPVYQSNYQLLSDYVDETYCDYILDDICGALLYSYLVGELDCGYPYPTVTNPMIASVTALKMNSKGSNALESGFEQAAFGETTEENKLLLIAADGVEYLVYYRGAFVDFIVSRTDGGIIYRSAS